MQESRREPKKAVIVAGGRLTFGPRVRATLASADLIIAADSGLAHCMAQDITPDLVIGDFDSTPRELLDDARSRGWEIRTHPEEKDATDGELALHEALAQGAREIVLLGVLEGDDRVDHALGNVLLLALPDTVGRSVRLLDEMREAYLVRGRELVTFSGERGDIVSLLPLTETAAGVTTWGLKYDMSGVSLRMGSTRGVSNELVWREGQVGIATGMLLVFHERLGA